MCQLSLADELTENLSAVRTNDMTLSRCPYLFIRPVDMDTLTIEAF